MAQKKLTRHQLKEDSFVTFWLNAWEYIRERQTQAFVVFIALVVIVAGSVWMKNSRAKARDTARTQFAEAIAAFGTGELRTAEEMFKIVTERFENMEEGVFAIYFTGKCELLDGRNSLAIESFEKYLRDMGKHTFFQDAAREGLATAYDNERNYARAAEIYLELAENTTVNHFLEKDYLKKAAETLKLSDQNEKAIQVYEKLLELSTGLERRDVELELAILRG
ncbi:MAG: hypothetical protein JXB45_10290 [Candidatus Krumholzibacteriota bacterium]|nr:hypothetical protein [Candidatus Krumholzibacteriota bacterium]